MTGAAQAGPQADASGDARKPYAGAGRSGAASGETASGPSPSEAGARPAAPSFDWKRFWIRSLIAIAIFNIVAGLLTWYFIFPRLHPDQ